MPLPHPIFVVVVHLELKLSIGAPGLDPVDPLNSKDIPPIPSCLSSFDEEGQLPLPVWTLFWSK